jgi:hypothetical protein
MDVTLDTRPIHYENVCPDSTGSGLAIDYDNLRCKGERVPDWKRQKNAFKSKFNNARDCVQGRLMRMASYDSKTASNVAQRSSHIPPIQYAYTYAKDCLKKISDDPSDLTKFKDSAGGLLIHVATIKPDIVNSQAFGGTDIEASIMRSNNNHLKQVLNKQYYSHDEWNTIYKGRKADKIKNFTGYDSNNYKEYMNKHAIYTKMTRKRKSRTLNKTRKHK